MRNDVVGWHEIGKARMSGYGRAGICFERDESGQGVTQEVSPKVSEEPKGDTNEVDGVFTEVDDNIVIPF